MNLWYAEDVLNSLIKKEDRILLRILSSNGVVVLNTHKGYKYEMDENEYTNNMVMLIN